MLTAGSLAKGSTGYVAIEKFTGTLYGRAGTFALQHSGTIARRALQLTSLAGSMTIVATDGKHSYTFDYTLPNAH